MKRRRALVAFAVFVPLVLLGAAKWVTRFRPVKVGAITGNRRVSYLDMAVHAGPHILVAGGGLSDWNRFDLAGGTRQTLAHESLVEGTDIVVQARTNAAGVLQLLLRKGAGAPLAYDLREPPTSEKQTRWNRIGAQPGYPAGNPDNYEAQSFARRNLRVSPAQNRVEVLWHQTYYRWNRATGALERRVKLDTKGQIGGDEISSRRSWALTRDGETLMLPTLFGISRFSTRTGKRVAQLNLPRFYPASGYGGWNLPSPYGAYAFYSTRGEGIKATTVRLFETRAGRLLWKFDLPTIDTNVIIAFTPDEKTIAIARPDLHAWELRDTQTGQIIRTLPLVPATECAAFSPDGAALYCVAGGTLYRQRAR